MTLKHDARFCRTKLPPGLLLACGPPSTSCSNMPVIFSFHDACHPALMHACEQVRTCLKTRCMYGMNHSLPGTLPVLPQLCRSSAASSTVGQRNLGRAHRTLNRVPQRVHCILAALTARTMKQSRCTRVLHE
ncbi:hypothetical protein BDW02DRAFT_115471 [Decorospora gaudefroyi]|uniref:Uncharacterized protein n=1 Tax=Decorospora gaudefroyi TaxID=184978 RepID=A0A6A5JZV3_9PLEO|nr:hypothetical protein BDW02DRAFT_115471 [Decorospora gaudefroyi]